jgi:hypothetical protein
MAQVHIHDSEIRRSGSDKALEILQSFIRQEVDVDPRYLCASLTADRLAIKVWLASHRGVYGVPEQFMGMQVIVMYPTYRGFERYWAH